MQIKLHRSTTSHLSEWPSLTSQQITNAGAGVEKCTLLHCCWTCKLAQLLWKTVWRYLRNLYIELPYDLAISLLGIYSGKTFLEKDTCTCMFLAALFTIAKTGKQTKCPSSGDWIKTMRCIYTMEYYSAIKRNQKMPFAGTWMKLGLSH